MRRLGCIFIFVLTTFLDPTCQGPVRATIKDEATEACAALGPFLTSLEDTMEEMNKDKCSDVEIMDPCLAPTVALLKKSCIKDSDGGKILEYLNLDKQCVVDLFESLKSEDHQTCLCGGLKKLEELSYMVQGVVCSNQDRGGRGVFLNNLLSTIQSSSSDDGEGEKEPVYKWGYGSINGPHTWASAGGFTNCSGSKQTPVSYSWSGDLPADRKKEPTPLKVSGWDFKKIEMKNTGHGAKISVTLASGSGVLSGGPLEGSYTILQYHFHWPCEHVFNGECHPLELHIVTKKDGVDDPVYTPMGLSVMGFVFKKGSSSDALKPLIDALPSIVESGAKTDLSGFKLEEVINPVLSTPLYGYYQGSLTTPPCTEVVEWINFLTPLEVSEEDIAKFEALKDDDGKVIKSNTRLGIYGDFDEREGVYYDASA